MTAREIVANASHGATDTARPLRIAARLFVAWRARRRRRAALLALMEFDEDRLRDIGLSRDDVRRAVGEL